MPARLLTAALLAVWLMASPAPPATAQDDPWECLCAKALQAITCKGEEHFNFIGRQQNQYHYNGFYASKFVDIVCTKGESTLVITSRDWGGKKVAVRFTVDPVHGIATGTIQGEICGTHGATLSCKSKSLATKAPDNWLPPAKPARKGQ